MLKTFFADLIFTSPFMGIGWMLLVSAAIYGLIVFNAWFTKIPWPWPDFKTMSSDLWEKTKIYFPNALWQDVLIVTIFFWLKEAIGFELAIASTALLFGMLGHMANPLLMGWCTAMGFLFCLHYNHYHNVFVLIPVHGFLATMLHIFTKLEMNLGFRVWRRE